MSRGKAVVTERRERTEACLRALSLRYAAPEWAFFPQVRNSTGFVKEARTADGLAMGLWPSRGLELHGFEVKVSRDDWLRELRNPEKAEDLFAYCDRWWLVTGSADVVKPGELPTPWGLLILRGETQLRCEVEAPKLAAAVPDRLFLAALLRRAVEVVTPTSRLRAEFQRGVDEGFKRAESDTQLAEDQARREERDAVAAIQTFEAASGVRIDNWKAGDIGAAVREVLAGPQWMRQMESIKRIAGDIIRSVDGLKAESGNR